jgi:hypothetical protein
MSRIGIGIRAKMELRGAARAKAQGKEVADQLDRISQSKKEVQDFQVASAQVLGGLLEVVTAAQLIRFIRKDIIDLATQEENQIANALSLSTSLLLLTFRIIRYQKVVLMLQAAISALGATGIAALGLGAFGLGLSLWSRSIRQHTDLLRQMNAETRNAIDLQTELGGKLGGTTYRSRNNREEYFRTIG